MLEQVFTRLGLGADELKVYLMLLEQGPSPAGRLAAKLKLPRSTLYGHLHILSNAGLVHQGEKRGVKLWQAEEPRQIQSLLQSGLNSWQSLSQSFNSFLPELESRQKVDFSIPRFNFFEGVEGVKHILRDLLLYRDIETQAFWPIKDMLEILGEDFHHSLNLQRIRQNIYTQGLWPASRAVDIKKFPFLGTGEPFKREIRKAPPGIDTTMGYWAYANKVAFVSSRKECFGFIVESMELRQLLKTQFDVLWNISTPVIVDAIHLKKFLSEV